MSASQGIGRLFELLSYYSFMFYYVKGKDLILSDFLSRKTVDDINPQESIPISFHVKEQLQDYFHHCYIKIFWQRFKYSINGNITKT